MQKIDDWFRWIGQHTFEVLNFALAVLAVLLVPITLARPDATLTWRIIAIGGAFILLVVVGLRFYERRRSRAYFLVAVTNQDSYINTVRADAARFFADHHIPEASINPVTSIRGLEAHQWSELIERTLGRLNELKPVYREIHFLSASWSLWNFALGTEIGDRHALHIYHYGSGALHPIWRVNRDIKTRKSQAGFSYTVCQPPRLQQPGASTDKAVVVFAVGSDQLVATVEKHVQTHLPELPLWVVGKQGELDAQQPGEWVTAAAELAAALDQISGAGSQELWLFGNLPSALSLMAGTAVGRFRRIHLMHFLSTEGTYREFLTLPWS
jgi:hypothetical protein